MSNGYALADEVGVQHTWLQKLVHLSVTVVRDFLVDLLLLVVAYLIASYFRQHIAFGRPVGTNYAWFSISALELNVLGLCVSYAVRLFPAGGGVMSRKRRAWTPLLAALVTTAAITVVLPSQSGLQKAYYVALVVLLAVLVVAPVGQSDRSAPAHIYLKRLWANRSLLRIWVQFNVQSRYAQAILGILWIVLLPLSTAVIMTIVYSQLLGISVGQHVPFIAFFLAGLVPWGLFNQAIASGMRSILNAMGLISQIYFPREIIVLSALGEALVDTFFMFVTMLIIDAFVGIWPNENYVALIPLLAIQLALTAGLMFLVSWLSVLVRDVPQLVSVLLQLIFYLCPIIYPLSIVPQSARFLFVINPLATLIDAYRTVIVYNSMPDWWALLYPAALSVGFLVFGYRAFKANEDTFADLV